MDCRVTLSANAGAALNLSGFRFWADAVHGPREPDFSTVTPALWEKMQACPAFDRPEAILFTHCHRDHYSRELTAQAASAWPEARLILPQPEFAEQLLLTGERPEFQFGDTALRFARLPHEKVPYPPIPHYGCIVERGGFRVLIAGDCALCSPALAEFAGETGIDLALLDFPWITLPRGRAFVEKVLRPEHLFVWHLPFSQDDRWGFRRAAARAAGLVNIPDVRLLQEPLQEERV